MTAAWLKRGSKTNFLLWVAASLALVGVFWPQHKVVVAPGASAIMMFDISQSMNTEDVRIQGKPTSRLELARRSAVHAIDNLPCGTAIGYGIFSAHRALLLAEPVEVCQHRVEIKHALSFVSSRMAWHGNSEVAKGYYESLEIAAALKPKAVAVFFTDGHEAPPLNRNLRPRFDGEVGAVNAVVAGLGGDRPVPIPKSDPSGRSLGFWKADEVLQIDRYSAKKISAGSSSYVIPEEVEGVDPRVAGSPGREHLSSIREPYLRLLAEETAGRYARIDQLDSVLKVLGETLEMPGFTAFDVRRYAALAALMALVTYYWLRLGGNGLSVLAPWNRAVSKLASKPS